MGTSLIIKRKNSINIHKYQKLVLMIPVLFKEYLHCVEEETPEEQEGYNKGWSQGKANLSIWGDARHEVA